MRYHSRAFGHAGLLALVVFAFSAAAPGQSLAACSPDQGGKYLHEIYRLLVPEDLGQYGDCNDYGFWEGGSYAGHTGIPPGYWVYAHPYWYVWAEEAAAGNSARSDGCSIDQGRKYSGLLHELYLPTDSEDYGTCYDWGWWSNSSYAGYEGLSPGFWVYAYPNWYVWAREN